MHVGNALAMASDMLLPGADEVARNGAFGKSLRPEVFPNAPCKLRLSPGPTPSRFPAALPPNSLLEVRISGETGGVPFGPFSESSSTSSGENQLLLHVDAGLAQQLGHHVAF